MSGNNDIVWELRKLGGKLDKLIEIQSAGVKEVSSDRLDIDYKAGIDILCALIEKIHDDNGFTRLGLTLQKQVIDVGAFKKTWLGRQ